jgi:hypothetical protein
MAFRGAVVHRAQDSSTRRRPGEEQEQHGQSDWAHDISLEALLLFRVHPGDAAFWSVWPVPAFTLPAIPVNFMGTAPRLSRRVA